MKGRGIRGPEKGREGGWSGEGSREGMGPQRDPRTEVGKQSTKHGKRGDTGRPGEATG